jgi:hypothetical protein
MRSEAPSAHDVVALPEAIRHQIDRCSDGITRTLWSAHQLQSHPVVGVLVDIPQKGLGDYFQEEIRRMRLIGSLLVSGFRPMLVLAVLIYRARTGRGSSDGSIKAKNASFSRSG